MRKLTRKNSSCPSKGTKTAFGSTCFYGIIVCLPKIGFQPSRLVGKNHDAVDSRTSPLDWHHAPRNAASRVFGIVRNRAAVAARAASPGERDGGVGRWGWVQAEVHDPGFPHRRSQSSRYL